MSVHTIPDDIKMGREYALLGNYDTSLVYYEGACQALKKKIASCSTSQKQKWTAALNKVTEEYNFLRDIKNELRSFKADKPTPAAEAPSDPDVWGPPPPKPEYKKPFKANPAPPRVSAMPPRLRAAAAERDNKRSAAAAAPRSSRSARDDPGRNVGGLYKNSDAEARRGARASRKPPLDTGLGGRQRSGGAAKADDGKGKKKKKEFNAEGWDLELVTALQRDIVSDDPNVHWDDIAGNKEAKRLLEEAVVLPLLIPDYFTGIRRPWKGVLMTGPPGTGKTLLAKAVANQTSATFLRVVGSELIQKYAGDGPKLVRELFRVAGEHAPSIVFMDEIDAVGTKRYDSTSGGEREIQRTMLELLNQLDGFDSRGDVKVIMATNRIDSLDPALIRPGRIDRKIEFPLPNEKTKRRIFGIHTAKMTLSDDVDVEQFVMSKDELSGADIKAICTEAGLMALRERRMKVTNEDFQKSKENVLYRKKEGTPEGLYL
mmetsp:Transcript_11962/g.30751  ORF Transcript_11962/g.30751 Transcript_11962/m.30751 type:complete len:487 (-) Transcript_11962:69-1529(-)